MTHIFCLLNNKKKIIYKNIENIFYYDNLNYKNIDLYDLDIKSTIGLKTNNKIKVKSNIGDIHLLCDGEIYNYKELSKMLDIKIQYENNNDIIIHLYRKYGIKHTLNLLDGIYSFILYDFRIINNIIKTDMYIARDEYGLKPFYYMINNNKPDNTQYFENIYGFSTDKNLLENIGNNEFIVEEVKPSSYYYLTMEMKVNANWDLIKKEHYYRLPLTNLHDIDLYIYDDNYQNKLLYLFKRSVEKRIKYMKTDILYNGYIHCILTSNVYDIFMASYLSNHYDNVVTYALLDKNDEKELKYLSDISILIKSIHIKIKEQDMDNNNIKYLFVSKGKESIFGLDIEYDKMDILNYDKMIRDNINIIYKKIEKQKNIILFNPFLDKYFMEYYISNHLILKKNNYKNIIPYSFISYLPKITKI